MGKGTSVKITSKDNGYLAMREAMKRLGGSVSVGVHAAEGAQVHKESLRAEIKGVVKAIKKATRGEKGDSDKAVELVEKKKATREPVTIADIAYWNEFGLGVP